MKSIKLVHGWIQRSEHASAQQQGTGCWKMVVVIWSLMVLTLMETGPQSMRNSLSSLCILLISNMVEYAPLSLLTLPFLARQTN
jgi:hypothetical protein